MWILLSWKTSHWAWLGIYNLNLKKIWLKGRKDHVIPKWELSPKQALSLTQQATQSVIGKEYLSKICWSASKHQGFIKSPFTSRKSPHQLSVALLILPLGLLCNKTVWVAIEIAISMQITFLKKQWASEILSDVKFTNAPAHNYPWCCFAFLSVTTYFCCLIQG